MGEALFINYKMYVFYLRSNKINILRKCNYYNIDKHENVDNL